MVEDFGGIEAGDLLRATKTVFVVDPEMNPTDTLWEGNTAVYPKGIIALVVETHVLPDESKTPVLTVLIKEKIAVVLCFGFEIVRKNGQIPR